ncbi:hypothetical protein DFQ27_001474 [Actinomortierella ambigua]|uniref:USP domain-containing protein n=1 Tax=Actinomortierella ambigua TaxID=1343610 RepID=A0A9P6QIN0_9FUNG|nr:hypothetical protein DFQ27_001474 [Actinomortierella ambigua]
MPLPKRTDRLWKFVGTEVSSKNDLTFDHVRAAYGLTCNDHGSHGQEESGQRKQITTFPYCGNKFERQTEPPTTSSTNWTSGKCSAAKCKDNPNCLNYLGQEQWESEDAFENYRAIRSLGTNDARLSKRNNGYPVGLRNLGATCYASSLLQCWFQDYDFRNTIFQCQLSEDNGKLESSPLYQLQLLFGFLDSGLRSVYNPESLVKVLKLDAGVQQDAQE